MNKTSYYNILQNLVGLRNSALGSKIIKEETTDKELCKEVLQISKEDITDNKLCEKVKLRFILDRIIESANKQLSCYRQRKEDLIARMATDWPKWGCGVDFYTFFILPFIKNPLLLHFINLSENVDLSKIIFKSGYYEANGKITYIEENLKFDNNTIKADAIDLAIDPVTQSYSVNTEFITENRRSFLVRVRDADIGVQAFFSLLEGIIRNSAKHGIKEDKFDIRIIFFEDDVRMGIFLNTNIQANQRDNEDKKYCYVLISINRDLIDSSDGKRKVGNKELIEFISDSLKDTIIDVSTGELMPGKWGLKEIKTCAAFLAGEDLSEVNSSKPKFMLIDKNKGLWEDKKERLVYIIRLEKQRYIMAVVNEVMYNNINKGDWLNNGIKIVFANEFENTLKNRDVDYDFLYIDDSVINSALVDLIQQNKCKLPQREVKGTFNLKNYNEFIYKVYDSYISELWKINNFHFTIYFDDEKKAEIWEKHKNENAYFSFPTKSEETFRVLNNKKQIFIVRHTKISQVVLNQNRCTGNLNILYFQSASNSDPFFSFLMSIDPKNNPLHLELVLRQIVESTLLNILIIDERIAQSLLNLKAPDEPEIDLEEKLYWMGIYIAKTCKIDDENTIKWMPQNTIQNNTKRMVDTELNNIGNIEGQKIDILLIHATRLNEIFKKVNNYKKIEDFVDCLRRKIPHIIVHSGRGYTKGDIPSNIPFLEYSIIQKYVLQEPSKFYLVQIALNARGEL